MRGLDKQVVLHQVLPAELGGRHFAKLRLEVDVEVGDSSATGNYGDDSQQNSSRRDSDAAESIAERAARRTTAFSTAFAQYMSTYYLLLTLFSLTKLDKRKGVVAQLTRSWRTGGNTDETA